MKVVVPQSLGITYKLIPQPINDHDYNGEIVTMMVGEDVNFRDLLYLKSDSKLWKANATNKTKLPVLALALETISANKLGKVLLYGFIRDDSWSWNIGFLFAGFDDGKIVQIDTDLLLPNNQVQVIGYATQPNIIFFRPDLSIEEIKIIDENVSCVYSQIEKLNLELELSFKTSEINNYKEFSYDNNGNLLSTIIYKTTDKLDTLFDKRFTYTLDNLTKIVLTRHSDGIKLIKNLMYDINGNLFSTSQIIEQ